MPPPATAPLDPEFLQTLSDPERRRELIDAYGLAPEHIVELVRLVDAGDLLGILALLGRDGIHDNSRGRDVSSDQPAGDRPAEGNSEPGDGTVQ
jgi:hypothetical protein